MAFFMKNFYKKMKKRFVIYQKKAYNEDCRII